MIKSIRIVTVVVMMFAFSCLIRPDVVVRPGSDFTKDSSITLIVTGQDVAIFKPELEKELMRLGFNVISDSVANVISKETKTGDLKAAGVASIDAKIDKVAAKAQANEVTEKSTSTIINSEYVGKIDYLYDKSYNVSRVNFSIIELKTGTIVASIVSHAQGRGNGEIAWVIAKELETALGHIK